MDENKNIQNNGGNPQNAGATNTQTPKKSGGAKVFIIILIIVLVIAGLGVGAFFLTRNIMEKIQDGGSTISIGSGSDKEKVKVTQNKTSQIKYAKYDNSLVSFEYPEGWKVEVGPYDYIHYSFKVYDPSNPNRMMLFNLKQEGALKSEKARQVYAKLYPESPFAKIIPIDPQTTEAFYKVWNPNAKLNNAQGGVEFFPQYNNFTVIGTLGKDMLGGDVLRATYTDANGKKCQGIFTASVKSIGTYNISEDIWNPLGPQVDVSPLNIYNIITMTAPDEEFVEWQGILDHCVSTIEFSSTFISGFNQQESTIVGTVQANQKIYDSMSDMIMSSWEARNNSYDIMSQKQSDATLGYERVYDTETGDIYKAYNGFTDDYKGERYQPITDDMYTKTTAGYIEK